MSSTPGRILFGGIVLMDEPESFGTSTFTDNGEVLMTFYARPGGNVSQIIMGLTPNMAQQMIEALHKYDDVYARAIAAGKGGARFVSRSDTEERG